MILANIQARTLPAEAGTELGYKRGLWRHILGQYSAKAWGSMTLLWPLLKSLYKIHVHLGFYPSWVLPELHTVAHVGSCKASTELFVLFSLSDASQVVSPTSLW